MTKIAHKLKTNVCTVSKVINYFMANGTIPTLAKSESEEIVWPSNSEISSFMDKLWADNMEIGGSWNEVYTSFIGEFPQTANLSQYRILKKLKQDYNLKVMGYQQVPAKTTTESYFKRLFLNANVILDL